MQPRTGPSNSKRASRDSEDLVAASEGRLSHRECSGLVFVVVLDEITYVEVILSSFSLNLVCHFSSCTDARGRDSRKYVLALCAIAPIDAEECCHKLHSAAGRCRLAGVTSYFLLLRKMHSGMLRSFSVVGHWA